MHLSLPAAEHEQPGRRHGAVRGRLPEHPERALLEGAAPAGVGPRQTGEQYPGDVIRCSCDVTGGSDDHGTSGGTGIRIRVLMRWHMPGLNADM